MEIAEGTRKRSRSSNGDGGSGSSAGGPDRLSALPDCLLHIIMSSLKARQAVQTCVLSTRWRHLWRSVPCLDIDIVEFRTKAAAPASSSAVSNSSSDSDDSDSDSGSSQDKAKEWDEFEDFAVNLMLRCNISLLDSFRLDIDRGWRRQSYGRDSAMLGWEYSGRQAAAWLRRAMKYCTPAPCQRQGLNLNPSFWRLRRLHLCHVPLDGHFTVHLRSVCCCLEDLELDHCTGEIRSIASDSLKNLVLRSCRWGGFLSDIASPTLKTLVIDGGSNVYGNRLLAISAPMVAYLRLDVDCVSFGGGISINEMPSLDMAWIHLHNHKYSFVYKSMGGSKLGGDQSKLLCGVSNVTRLKLLGVGTMVLHKEPKFLEFQNLRNLLLGDCDLSDDFRLLRFFHRVSPNLEKVTLRHCKFPGDSEDKEGTHKLDKTSSSGCYCGLDFLPDQNVELEVIHKDGDACRSAGKLVCHLPNLKALIKSAMPKLCHYKVSPQQTSSRELQLEPMHFFEKIGCIALKDRGFRNLSSSKLQDMICSSPATCDTSAAPCHDRGPGACRRATFIWKNSVPPRIQFFMWLVSKGRIQCRANLFRKRIVPDSQCEICRAAEETTEHIIFHCPFAKKILEPNQASVLRGPYGKGHADHSKNSFHS